VVDVIINGDFENGLTGWRITAGTAFAGQPVAAAGIGAADVLLGGSPPVGLGGDYWHTSAFPLGHEGDWLVRVVTAGAGALDSDVFTVTARYLAFRIGGGASGEAALELRVPTATAQALDRTALDDPDDEGFVAVVIATPDGSDPLREHVVDLVGVGQPGSLLGHEAKVRLRITRAVTDGRPVRPRRIRLLADRIRLLDDPPAPFHRPVWGWADIHSHPMAQAGTGNLLAGHVHGPVEDVGSCLEIHGSDHSSPTHWLSALAFDEGLSNDGSTRRTGWPVAGSPDPDDQGFRGWPAFDQLTHLTMHQDWIRRAYDGGLRLMVALVVHNQVLAALSTGLEPGTAQSDRDVVEPQVQLLREFVAHNRDWCGLATDPDGARRLVDDNKLAFVLGLETDSVNDWIRFDDLPHDDNDANRAAVRGQVHDAIHGYFGYLRDLGIVQINLVHLSDNAFGGMALYDVFFVVNTWLRTGRIPEAEDGFHDEHGALRPAGEAIRAPVTVGSDAAESFLTWAAAKGFPVAGIPGSGIHGQGDRNRIGLTPAGEEALLEAMRLGMVIDMDHMSEKATITAYGMATGLGPAPYPLVAAHNGARQLAMDPPKAPVGPHDPKPMAPQRRNPKTWASESTKSESQLRFIAETGGMFGHGIAGIDSQPWPSSSVANDAPGTSKTVAQGLQFITDKLGTVALGTDANILIGGPGPRFGPMAVPGLIHELTESDQWSADTRVERAAGAAAQTGAVRYSTPLRDWRSYRFRDSGLYDDLLGPLGGVEPAVREAGRHVWQALVLLATSADLTDAATVEALTLPGGARPALDLALGMSGAVAEPSIWFLAGVHSRDPNGAIPGDARQVAVVAALSTLITRIEAAFSQLSSGSAPPLHRSTAGPLRDFDYNIDGLAHYGMLPDLLQDLRNVGLPPATFTAFFRSAERYIQVWERCAAVGATIPHPPVTKP
jgi:Membrane dipeptidase (Peptidase family M19)